MKKVVVSKNETLNNPVENIIKLDIDSKKPRILQKVLWKINQLSDWFTGWIVLETNKGFHFYGAPYIQLSKEQIFCLELLLNTDEFKMAIDLKRLVKGYRFWNVLFQMKYKNETFSYERKTLRAKILEEKIKERRPRFTFIDYNDWYISNYF